MNGFGKDLEEKTIEGRIFHSCTLEGLNNLIQNFATEQAICCSTEASTRLFGREMVVVFEAKEYTGTHTEGDADAGKDYGYDEFRVNFSSIEDLIDSIESVQVGAGWIENWEESCEDENSPDACFFHLIEDSIPYPSESSETFYNFN